AIEGGDDVGEDHGLAKRGQEHGRAQPHALGARGHCSEQGERLVARPRGDGVTDPHGVEAPRLRVLRHGQERARLLSPRHDGLTPGKQQAECNRHPGIPPGSGACGVPPRPCLNATTYWPMNSSALRSGALEIFIRPSSGEFISITRKMAAAIEQALTMSARNTIQLRGAKRPKLT